MMVTTTDRRPIRMDNRSTHAHKILFSVISSSFLFFFFFFFFGSDSVQKLWTSPPQNTPLCTTYIRRDEKKKICRVIYITEDVYIYTYSFIRLYCLDKRQKNKNKRNKRLAVERIGVSKCFFHYIPSLEAGPRLRERVRIIIPRLSLLFLFSFWGLTGLIANIIRPLIWIIH